jgi:5-methylcytosine-specific restriction endonuclease McrA
MKRAHSQVARDERPTTLAARRAAVKSAVRSEACRLREARKRGKAPPQPTKPCANCGKVFERNTDWSNSQWARRRFCSKECVNPKLWGANISEGLKKRWAEEKPEDLRSCDICFGLYYNKTPNQRTCGDNRCRYEVFKSSDPIRARAVTMGSCVKLGQGKIEFMTELLGAALAKPCVYCSTIITLKNASLDHIVPLGGLRGKPLAKHLDRRDNLQIICSRCNRGKGNLSDRGFRKLVEFLRSDPEISAYVWRRIAGGGVQFMAWRVNQRRRAR